MIHECGCRVPRVFLFYIVSSGEYNEKFIKRTFDLSCSRLVEGHGVGRMGGSMLFYVWPNGYLLGRFGAELVEVQCTYT